MDVKGCFSPPVNHGSLSDFNHTPRGTGLAGLALPNAINALPLLIPPSTAYHHPPPPLIIAPTTKYPRPHCPLLISPTNPLPNVAPFPSPGYQCNLTKLSDFLVNWSDSQLGTQETLSPPRDEGKNFARIRCLKQ
ncbi:hypothetical protein BO99DRAFT_181924 [Aspergillus violaceofuscus CBS 115571]|uniref:Uncharacterized protein n=1 Tax=Aspergillus violaceofuscus (strain CBS 115571) TaxID=1450538 RepID=A0A2V5I4Y4_ASPV1|nr:hypothetical protein BO99DRAFT_181924 [Aspergillus violaceofuscus CBS 115571]